MCVVQQQVFWATFKVFSMEDIYVSAHKQACQIAYRSKNCTYCNWDKLPRCWCFLESYTHQTRLNENSLQGHIRWHTDINTHTHSHRVMKQFYITQSCFRLQLTKCSTEITEVIPGPLSSILTPVVISLCECVWMCAFVCVESVESVKAHCSDDEVCFVNFLRRMKWSCLAEPLSPSCFPLSHCNNK